MRSYLSFFIFSCIPIFTLLPAEACPPSKYISIEYRVNQNSGDEINDPSVKIFAPSWIKPFLQKLGDRLRGVSLRLPNNTVKTLNGTLTLSDLVLIARNEKLNVTGIIPFKQYKGLPAPLIYFIKDLVRQCVIIGSDEIEGYGGYHSERVKVTPPCPVYLLDLIGLQYQEPYNTGRLTLIFKEAQEATHGWMEEELYEKLVGEKKLTYTKAKENNTGRFVPVKFMDKSCFLDTKAYVQIIKKDFLLAILALNQQAKQGEKIIFKFVAYGAGFFAESLTLPDKETHLKVLLAKGVYAALQHLFKMDKEKWSKIKGLELPFYKNDKTVEILKAIEDLCYKNGLSFKSNFEDTLKPRKKGFTIATTNAGDPHAATGNEMGYSSVDAAIASNLKSKGHKYSPLLNKGIQEEFLDF